MMLICRAEILWPLYSGHASRILSDPGLTFRVLFNTTVSQIWRSLNIRFNLLEQANTELFVVYNDVYTGGDVRNRSFTVKYTHVFDLLHKKE